MKFRKMLGLFCMYLALVGFIIIPEFPSDVSAEIKTFKLEDSFEDTYQNKIYTKYDNATEENTVNGTWTSIFRPNSAGTYTENTAVGSSPNYACVDEAPPNDATDYVRSANLGTWKRDLYNIPDSASNETEADSVILGVTVYIRCRQSGGTTSDSRIFIRTHSTDYYIDVVTSGSWDTDNYEWTNNPNTASAWTWTEIDNLEIGVQLKGESGLPSYNAQCTQVYAEVEFRNYTKYLSSETIYEQETTYGIAYSGLRSYFYNHSNYQNVSAEWDLQYKNASIIIDIGFLEIFPQSIKYLMKSDVPHNLSLCFNDSSTLTEYLLTSESNYSTFRRVRETISREDFILNSTTYDEFYFKIDFNTTTPIYIDDLVITYTDLRPVYDTTVRTPSGTDLDDISYNYTDNFITFEPSATAVHGINDDNDGLIMDTESNNFFTRRMFCEYDFLSNTTHQFSNLWGFSIYQVSNFHLDGVYTIEQAFTFNPNIYSGNYCLNVEYTLEVYKDGQEIYYINEIPYYYLDEQIEYFYDFKVSTFIYQETEDSLTIGAHYENADTGNSTDFREVAVRLNDDLPRSTLVVANVTSQLYWINNPTFWSDTDGTCKIFRTITHSDTNPSLEPSINFFSNLNWDSPLGSLINILTFPIRFCIGLVKFCMSVYQAVAFIGNLIKEFKELFSGFSDSWVGNLDSSLAGNLENAFDGIDTDVEGNLAQWSIISDGGDIWDDYEARDWTNLESSFGGVFPEVDYTILSNNEDLANGFWKGILGFGVTDVWTPSLNIFTDIIGYITLFIMIFFMSILLRLLRGDFESLFRDASRIFHGIQFIINAIVSIFKWIFDIISLILNVAIPFT